ncbi:MAG: peptide chain release factor 2 [candidate division WOR-3 bacterium]
MAKRIKEVLTRLQSLREFLEIEGKEKELQELNQKIVNWYSDKPISADPTSPSGDEGIKILRKIQQLKETLKVFADLTKEAKDLEELAELWGEDSPELVADIQRVEKKIQDLELKMLFQEEDDAKNCILTIHPGAGGLESCDWANILFRMYLRFMEKKKFNYKILNIRPNEGAGIKEVVLEIIGENAYGFFKSETGVHRLVRISPFDGSGRRHTSFASVFVLPEIPEIEIKIEEKDLAIETFRASGHGGQHVNKASTAVRITHLPTGIQAVCQEERSQYLNKVNALKILRARLYNYYKEKEKEKIQKYEEKKTDIAWGHQIRSYVLFPYQLVKDHRTNYETNKVEEVLDGEIEEFILAYLKKKVSRS